MKFFAGCQFVLLFLSYTCLASEKPSITEKSSVGPCPYARWCQVTLKKSHDQASQTPSQAETASSEVQPSKFSFSVMAGRETSGGTAVNFFGVQTFLERTATGSTEVTRTFVTTVELYRNPPGQSPTLGYSVQFAPKSEFVLKGVEKNWSLDHRVLPIDAKNDVGLDIKHSLSVHILGYQVVGTQQIPKALGLQWFINAALDVAGFRYVDLVSGGSFRGFQLASLTFDNGVYRAFGKSFAVRVIPFGLSPSYSVGRYSQHALQNGYTAKSFFDHETYTRLEGSVKGRLTVGFENGQRRGTFSVQKYPYKRFYVSLIR